MKDCKNLNKFQRLKRLKRFWYLITKYKHQPIWDFNRRCLICGKTPKDVDNEFYNERRMEELEGSVTLDDYGRNKFEVEGDSNE